MNRREALIASGGLLAGVWLGACDGPQHDPGPAAPTGMSLVDVHCHIFNASDLPTVRFIKIVILHHYPKQGIQTLDIRDPDALDGLIALLTAVVGRTRAPTATAEIAVLDGKAPPLAVNGNTTENETAVVQAAAAFLSQDQVAVAGGVSPSAVRTIRTAILSAAGLQGAAVSDVPLASDEANALAAKSYRSDTDLGLILRWFALFTRYRYVLAAQLSDDQTKEGFTPLLLCPATIDYDHWLGENVDLSPLPDQVRVMSALARRTTGPAVLPYVAFDPLRQAYFSAGLFKQFDPLALVREAIRDAGFLGVKLYPPMGFRPFANEAAVCQAYPSQAVEDLFPEAPADPATAGCTPRPMHGSVRLGQALDKAMADLFDLCVTEDACVIAHANRSNESNQGYADRADPAHWVPVFKRWPTLRVCLAHFGTFGAVSAGSSGSRHMPEASWEWELGRYVRQAGDPPVFSDISYLTEIPQDDGQALRDYAAVMTRWLTEFDPDCRHLMFGTDWAMLGIDRAYEGYRARVHGFFRDAVGIDKTRIGRLFYGNAARFLGLRQGDGARERVLRFYDRHNVPRSRLPIFPAV